MSQEAARILPCPFCGGEASIGKTYAGGRYAFCTKCGVRQPINCKTDIVGNEGDVYAIDLWNTRAPAIADAIIVTQEQYDKLCEILDAPPKDLPGLRKLLSAPAIADGVGVEWQTMESAPNKGEFIAWNPHYNRAFYVFRDTPGDKIVVDPVRGRSWIAEYWRPAFTPPQAATDEG